MAGPFCGVCRGVEHLLSEPPRRMDSARKGPMSRDRPQAAAELGEDRVRTVARPAALDSGPCALCVVQEAASEGRCPAASPAAGPRHRPPPTALRSARIHMNPRDAGRPADGLTGPAVHARPLQAFPGSAHRYRSPFQHRASAESPHRPPVRRTKVSRKHSPPDSGRAPTMVGAMRWPGQPCDHSRRRQVNAGCMARH